MKADIDDLIKNNLRRLLAERGLQQNRLAELSGVTPSVINDILAGRRPMGKALMAILCEQLDVEPWAFYWTEKTPIARNEQEQKKLLRYREEERLGLADEVERYEDYMIDKARHPSADRKEGQKPGVARRKRRAG